MSGAHIPAVRFRDGTTKDIDFYNNLFIVKSGNGDPSLTLFPREVTPNLHKLAREFVLLDNFYAAFKA